jgi:hypothetical protein
MLKHKDFKHKSLIMNLFGALGDIHRRKNWKTRQYSSHDPSDGNKDYVSLDPGETKTITNLEEPGCITRIWFALNSPDQHILRKLLLRFTWDDEINPSVETPLGDFFGVGFAEYVHSYNAVFGMTSGGFYSYWPMPFNKAKITAENTSKHPVTHLYYAVQVHEIKHDDKLRFHCKYNRENPTTIDTNYTILRATGAGHYAGCVLNMQSYDKGSILMLQGDEYITVDNEEKPSIIGTGTEDYFQGGWFWNKGAFHAPYHGLTVQDEVNSRYSAYRLHIVDPIPFKESIRVEIEHGHANMLQQDYSSVAYWYQTEPHNPDFGRILENPDYLTPIGTKDGAYLMSELVQDPPINRERRQIIAQAAMYRHELREAKKTGIFLAHLEGITEEMFMKADYQELVNLVEIIVSRKNG